jgi:hypothetical protein
MVDAKRAKSHLIWLFSFSASNQNLTADRALFNDQASMVAIFDHVGAAALSAKMTCTLMAIVSAIITTLKAVTVRVVTTLRNNNARALSHGWRCCHGQAADSNQASNKNLLHLILLLHVAFNWDQLNDHVNAQKRRLKLGSVGS